MSGSSGRVPRYTKFDKAASVLVIAYIGSPLIGFAGDGAGGPGLSRISDRMALLERVFWRCDYTATTRGIDATPMETCGAVYATLKDEKFDGSFENLLRWWTKNKEQQHLNIRMSVGEML